MVLHCYFQGPKIEAKMVEIGFFEGLKVKILNISIKYKLKIPMFPMLFQIFKQIQNKLSLLEHFPFLQTQYGIINDQNGAPVKGAVLEICFFKDLEVKISKKVIKYILKIRPFSIIYLEPVMFQINAQALEHFPFLENPRGIGPKKLECLK